MLTPKQYKLLLFINQSIKETGGSPSFEEMKEAVGLKSKSGIHALIEALEERGFIRKMPHKARALEVLKLPKHKPSAIVEEEKAKDGFTAIPLYGKIAAGTPIDAIADEQEKVFVPEAMLGRGDYYSLTIDGDSMVEAGILDGDTVVIKRQDIANNGDIVVALVNEETATLKEFKKQKDKIYLIPKNSDHQTQIYNNGEVRVQGILIGLLRTYH